MYNGKELQTDFGLDWSDYGARYYDAAIGRWGQVDPLAESMASWSPYNYTFGNPIGFNDPTGLAPETIVVGGDKSKAENDIRSTVAPKYRDRIKVDADGVVTVNKDGLKLEELDSRGDAGLTTLINLEESSNTYLYESAEKTTNLYVDGTTQEISTADFPDRVSSINSSRDGKQILPKVSEVTIKGKKVDVQGKVAIHPKMVTYGTHGRVKPRGALVFHALEEVYQRTDLKLPYGGATGAHEGSIKKAEKTYWENRKNGIIKITHGHSSTFGIIK